MAVTFLWAKCLHILHTSQCGESILVLKVLGLSTYSYGHFHWSSGTLCSLEREYIFCLSFVRTTHSATFLLIKTLVITTYSKYIAISSLLNFVDSTLLHSQLDPQTS